jgi:hypothetical protein
LKCARSGGGGRRGGGVKGCGGGGGRRGRRRGRSSPHSGAVHHDGMPRAVLPTSRAAWVHRVCVHTQRPARGLGHRGAGAAAVVALAAALLPKLPERPGEGKEAFLGAR